MIAVAIPCNALIAVFNLLAFIADKISDTAYKKVTATIVQNEILLSPQTVFLELDELEDLLLLDFADRKEQALARISAFEFFGALLLLIG